MSIFQRTFLIVKIRQDFGRDGIFIDIFFNILRYSRGTNVFGGYEDLRITRVSYVLHLEHFKNKKCADRTKLYIVNLDILEKFQIRNLSRASLIYTRNRLYEEEAPTHK